MSEKGADSANMSRERVVSRMAFGGLVAVVCVLLLAAAPAFAVPAQKGAARPPDAQQKQAAAKVAKAQPTAGEDTPAAAEQQQNEEEADEAAKPEPEATADGAAADSAATSQQAQREQATRIEDLEHADDHGNEVEVGAFPGSMLIPGTTLSFRIGGYAKVDYLQDFQPAGDPTLMRPDTIPLEGTPESELGPSANLQAGQSRFNFDVRSPTPAGNFRAFIEIDFFINNAPHFRHAYGTLGHLLGGQTWSTFMDISAEPVTAGFGGDGAVFTRKALIRWEMPIGDSDFTWAVAVEDPQSSVYPTEFENADTRAATPDFVGRIRYQPDRFHFQLAGLAKQVRLVGTDLDSNPTALSWGVNLTGAVKVGGLDDFKWQVAYGPGIFDYYLNLGPTQKDAILGADGELQLIPMTSVMLAYEHFWTPMLRSTFKWEGNFITNQPAQTGEMTDSNWATHVNLIYSPWKRVNLYGEYIYGSHRVIDGREGNANRFMFSAQFIFG